jgi:hypothetical protein
MEDNWFNMDPNDGFNPEDHDIEMDEISKMYAMSDMKESQEDWARERAELFYSDFSSLDIPASVSAVISMINAGEFNLTDVNTMLDNMIYIFQNDEEYEKCNICLKIKNGINDKI